jgi:mRNA interferase MazF
VGREIRRGEIRWYAFKPPNKRRPVLVLTRDSVLSYLKEATVVPITSIARDIPSEVPLTRADGVPQDCVANFDHILTVPQARLGPLIATLSARRWTEVRAALLFALGF